MKNTKKLFVSAVLSLSLLGGVFAPAASAEVVVSGSITLPDAVGNSVRIQDVWGDVMGSGFFIKGDRVVTNYHVTKYVETFAFNGTVNAVDGHGNKYSMKLLAYDKEADLAIYQTDAKGHDYFSIADTEGNGALTAIVNSSTQKFEKLEGGVINYNYNSTVTMQDGSQITRDRYALGFKSIGGNSGSPVLDDYNRVVGVVMGSAHGGYGVPEKSAIAIHLGDIHAVIKKADAKKSENVAVTSP